MPRVVCTLRNASHLINGVRFASLGDSVDDGMLSEEISEDVAAGFLAIRGYHLHVMRKEAPPHHEQPQSKQRASAMQKEQV